MLRYHFAIATLISLSCWQTDGQANEPMPAAPTPSPVPAATQQQARERLEQWSSDLAQQPNLLAEVTFPRYELFDNWSTLDLDRAMVMDEGQENYRLRLLLMRKLAGHKRWDDLVRVSKRDSSGSYQVHKLWAQIAQIAAAENDLRTIELAGEQVEQNATFDQGSIGAPSRPSLALSGARFFIAAARLDLLRNLPSSRERLDIAQRELWFTAGAFSPFRTGFGPLANHHDLTPKYAALETWSESETSVPWLNPGKDPLAASKIKALTWRHIYWPSNLELPKLDEDIANAWFRRQLEQDRRDVALTYVAIAEGDLLHRARLLAIAAPYLKTEQQQQAIEISANWIDNSGLSLPTDGSAVPNESRLWLKLEAEAELAATMNRLSKPNGAELLRSALSDFAQIATEKNFGYSAFSTILRTAANHNLQREDLPAAFTAFVDRHISLQSRTADRYGIYSRGMQITTDISQIVKASSVYRSPRSERYYQLVEERNWIEIVDEIKRLADGNRAWMSSWGETGARSVRELGLQKTLEWTNEIQLPEARFSVEMGAIEEALKPMKRSIPASFDHSSPKAVAPSIVWPSNGC